MTRMHSHTEIALASIKVFADDGRLDANELQLLLTLALRDGQVDDEEKRVLARIFVEAEKSALTDEVRRQIADARSHHGIPQ